ncbi:hypothetical protein ATANTOWER_025770 [Ataeniobius toweri]|uniref:Uncharacterized protein n=1 Tax=Ataeniobius toweri TaxID=208326 RepID=A0ABU7BRW8_9TELE|nr:hypothetical protein [Ataeniobius toweri]
MKTSRELRQHRREEIRKWKAAGKSYRLPADIRFQHPFWPPLRKDRQKEKERKQHVSFPLERKAAKVSDRREMEAFQLVLEKTRKKVEDAWRLKMMESSTSPSSSQPITGQSNTAPPALGPAADTITGPEESQAGTSGISGTRVTSRTPRKSAEPPLCPACGKSMSEAGHFVHRTKVFCESTSGGVSLLDWVKVNVPRVTRWRWKVQQEVIEAGVPALTRKKSICTKCHRRLTREMGHISSVRPL